MARSHSMNGCGAVGLSTNACGHVLSSATTATTHHRSTSAPVRSVCIDPEAAVPEDVIATLARLLDRAAIGYALIGGHAVNAWLEPRFTADIDLTVQTDPGKLRQLTELLEKEGYRVAAEHGGELPSGPDIVRFVSAGGDILVRLQAAKTALQCEIIQRASVAPSGVRVATREDVIVMKLIADRPKDRLDLIGLARLPHIDWLHVEHWAAEWQVADRLRRLRAETAAS